MAGKKVFKIRLPKIYALYESTQPDAIRYIGWCICDIRLRLADHIRDTHSGDRRYVHNWIRAVLSRGAAVEVKLLEVVTKDESYREAEKKWIRWHRWLGHPLTNLTEGGDGTLGWNPSNEFREKMRVRSLGRNNPMYGKPGTMQGKKFTDEQKKHVSMNHARHWLGKVGPRKGRPYKKDSVETRKLKSLSAKSGWLKRKEKSEFCECASVPGFSSGDYFNVQ